MIVVDNFLGIPAFEHIRNEMLSNRFPWTYNETKSHGDGNEDLDHFGNQQMFHMFYGFNNMIHKDHSQTLSLVWPILTKLKPLALLRIKANLQFGTNELYQSPFHTDVHTVPDGIDFKTCVYYLNTNDGLTMFEDTDESVESVENRIVIFDGRRKHAGTTCTDKKIRAVINLNFIPSTDTDLENLND